MNSKRRILLVEDDASMGFLLVDFLDNNGFEITLATDGKKGLELFTAHHFDLCILDVMLPGIDGFALASEIKQTNAAVPFIFLTARSMKPDKMKGFALGADDYVTKPYSFEELKMRIDVFLRRRKIIEEAPKEAIIIGKYNFDYANLDLSINGTSKGLTQREADILYYLAARPNQVIRRSDILEDIWGKDDYFYGRSLDVFISRLRKYLNEDPDIAIENVHSVRFKLNFPDGKIVE